MKNTNSQLGFTLIELITTIAIMVLILSLTIANIHGTDASRNTQLAASNLISDLHKVQTYAVNSEDYTAGVTPASAWSIQVAAENNYQIQSVDDTVLQNTQTVSTTQLPTNIIFESIQIQRPNGGGTYCPSQATIQFTVPYGRIITSYAGAAPCYSNPQPIIGPYRGGRGGGGGVSVNQEANDIITLIISSTDGSSIKSIVINGISGNIVTP